MVQKALFQYGENQLHIVQLKSDRHLQGQRITECLWLGVFNLTICGKNVDMELPKGLNLTLMNNYGNILTSRASETGDTT